LRYATDKLLSELANDTTQVLIEPRYLANAGLASSSEAQSQFQGRCAPRPNISGSGGELDVVTGDVPEGRSAMAGVAN